MLSIFCSYRNRPEMFNDFIEHYKSNFPDAFIFMCEQDDKKPFKRGQLMNVGFKEVLKAGIDLSNIMFIDVDIRMKYKIDFEGILNEHKDSIVIPYNDLQLYFLDAGGSYVSENKPSYFLNAPDGGVTLFSKTTFQKCNGFSNVYCGWGKEDSDFVRRNKVVRISNSMLHLRHNRNKEWTSPEFKKNTVNFDIKTNFLLDGFKQTTADATMSELQKNIYLIKIRNIGVVPDFAYMNLLAGNK